MAVLWKSLTPSCLQLFRLGGSFPSIRFQCKLLKQLPYFKALKLKFNYKLLYQCPKEVDRWCLTMMKYGLIGIVFIQIFKKIGLFKNKSDRNRLKALH